MLSILLSLALSGAVEFTAADGAPLVGQLVKLDVAGATLETADGVKTLPAGSVGELRPQSEPKAPRVAPTVWIELTDGSTLLGTQYTVAGSTATLTTLADEELTMPTKAIHSARFKEQNDVLAAQWADILKAEVNGDLIVIRKDKSIDYLAGVVGPITADTVTFEIEGEDRPVKRERVEGVIYARVADGPELPASFCSVRNAAGTRLEVARAEVADDQLHLRSPSGVELHWPLADVASISFKVQYLSDLEPEGLTFTPYVGTAKSLSPSAKLFSQPRFNRGFDGAEIHLGGQRFDKGLALRSHTELVFRLPPGYRALEGLAGIDDAVRPQGKVTLQIRGDERILAEHEIAGNQPPLPLTVNIEKCHRLTVVVDFDGDEVGDRLYLAGMRLVK